METQSPSKADSSVSEEWGYAQELPRGVRFIQSFAVGFSQISITAGIFGTLGVVLLSSGPLGAWTTWLITGVGFTLVALVYATLASRVPLTGHGYQYVSKIASGEVGWMVGWLTLLLTGIASLSVAYSIAAFVLPPLFGYTSNALNADLVAGGVFLLYMLFTMLSTRITALINEYAVYTEIVGMLAFSVILFLVVAVRGGLHWSYLVSQGPVHQSNFWSLGLVGGQDSAFVLAFVMALFTLFGFEACANVAEEMKDDARISVPRAIVLSEVVAAVAGLVVLLLVLPAAGHLKSAESAPSALSYIMSEQLGPIAGKLFLIVVLYSVFACGLVLFLSTSRMVWAMSRDERFFAASTLRRVHSSLGTPFNASAAVGVAGLIVFAAFITQTNVWNQLIGATSFPPFIIYPTVIIVFLLKRRHLPRPRSFNLGRLEVPVAVLALVWIAFGLSVFKSGFNPALIYTGGAIVLGIGYLTWYRRVRGPMTVPAGVGDGQVGKQNTM